MAFDALKYRMRHPFALTNAGDLTKTYTTAEVIKHYTPGQYAQTWDPLWGYRIFKLVKNLGNATLAKGYVVSCPAAASVGTVTAGSTTSVTTSGLTANDLEYQMITVADDAGGASAAPEGESSLCIANTSTVITLHPDYAFSAAVAASDSVYVVYVNAVEKSVTSDERGFGHGSIGVMGICMSAPADNEWFWILQRGWCTPQSAGAITAANNLRAVNTAYVDGASDGAQELEIGQISVGQNADATAGVCVTVFVDVFNTIHTTGTP